MIVFTIPGEPLAWARAGHRGRVSYTPTPQRNFMAAVRTICAAEMRGAPPLEGPLALEIHASYLWPKATSARKRRDPANAWKVSRPDADNLGKLVADALNAVAWRDDAQIASLHVWKQYANTASLSVCIRPILQNADSIDTWVSIGRAAERAIAGLAKEAAE